MFVVDVTSDGIDGSLNQNHCKKMFKTSLLVCLERSSLLWFAVTEGNCDIYTINISKRSGDIIDRDDEACMVYDITRNPRIIL